MKVKVDDKEFVKYIDNESILSKIKGTNVDDKLKIRLNSEVDLLKNNLLYLKSNLVVN